MKFITILFITVVIIAVIMQCEVKMTDTGLKNQVIVNDYLPPTLEKATSMEIANTESGVTQCDTVALYFSEAININTLTIDNISIVGNQANGSNPIYPKPLNAWEDPSTPNLYYLRVNLNLNPTTTINSDRYPVFQMTLKNIADKNNNISSSQTFSFGTCGNDMLPPKVIDIETETPDYQAIEGTRIFVHFDKPIDPSSITPSSFIIYNSHHTIDTDASGNPIYINLTTSIVSYSIATSCKSDNTVLEVVTGAQPIGNEWEITVGYINGHSFTYLPGFKDIWGNTSNIPVPNSYTYFGSKYNYSEKEASEGDDATLNNQYSNYAEPLPENSTGCVSNTIVIKGSLKYASTGTTTSELISTGMRDFYHVFPKNANCIKVKAENLDPPWTNYPNYSSSISQTILFVPSYKDYAFDDNSATICSTLSANEENYIWVARHGFWPEGTTSDVGYGFGMDYRLIVDFGNQTGINCMGCGW